MRKDKFINFGLEIRNILVTLTFGIVILVGSCATISTDSSDLRVSGTELLDNKNKRRTKNIVVKPNTKDKKMLPVEIGTWRSNGIELIVEDTTVKVKFGCASGEISKKLTTNEQGNFKISGTFSARTPGPLMADNLPKPQTAEYEGTVQGKIMTIKVTLNDTNHTTIEDKLELNGDAEFVECL